MKLYTCPIHGAEMVDLDPVSKGWRCFHQDHLGLGVGLRSEPGLTVEAKAYVVSVSEAISLSTTIMAATEDQAAAIGAKVLGAELDRLIPTSVMASVGTGWDDPVSVELRDE